MKRLTEENWLNRMRGRFIHPTERYKGMGVKIGFMCDACALNWKATPGNILAGKDCPKCSAKSGSRKRKRMNQNSISEDSKGLLHMDISTKKHKNAKMIINKEDLIIFQSLGNKIRSNGRYAELSIHGETHLAHRLILDSDDHIDHINGDGFDNRRSNLRVCSCSENLRNRTKRNKNNTSGVAGVRQRKDTGKWSATIMVDRKHISLGCFIDIDDAIKARSIATAKYFKDFAPKELS